MATKSMPLLLFLPKPTSLSTFLAPYHRKALAFFSTSSTPYPLQYDLIISRPAGPTTRPRLPRAGREPGPPDSDSDIGEWAGKKLSLDGMDKAKRKYYNKRRKRMYGTDSEEEEERKRGEDGFVELKPEVVNFPRLHQREEELYFYDAFAYPWEKDKHYKMVYQLEKKYFPGECLDKAFVAVNEVPSEGNVEDEKGGKKEGDGDGKFVFFGEEKNGEDGEKERGKGKGVAERKVEDLFKTLKRVRKEGGLGDVTGSGGKPFLVKGNGELPRQWDGPTGTVLLVNKPKGWTSFTVCGKLRRLVKVKKVGHAGTLDPMATGLLIVCVGKATKLADSYQGMIKGYSGVFRLGEATSTWDADSPVIQRESWEHIRDDDIKKIARSFLGEIWQVPPMFSAIKVGGEKMYEKARRGESIELAPRRISIFQFEIERSLEDRQNLVFRVTCSKGTYIRSLCADLGKALGSCAHLTSLRRDSIGEYAADDAWDFKDLEEAITKNYF